MENDAIPREVGSNLGLGANAQDLTGGVAWLWTHCRALGMTRRSDSGLMRDDVALFVADLHAALKKANDQAEAFERGWYLRGDALEALANAADAVGAPLEPTVRLHW